MEASSSFDVGRGRADSRSKWWSCDDEMTSTGDASFGGEVKDLTDHVGLARICDAVEGDLVEKAADCVRQALRRRDCRQTARQLAQIDMM